MTDQMFRGLVGVWVWDLGVPGPFCSGPLLRRFVITSPDSLRSSSPERSSDLVRRGTCGVGTEGESGPLLHCSLACQTTTTQLISCSWHLGRSGYWLGGPRVLEPGGPIRIYFCSTLGGGLGPPPCRAAKFVYKRNIIPIPCLVVALR